MKLRGYIIQGFIVFLSLTLGLNLFRSWTQLSRRGDILAQEQTHLDKEQLRKEHLKRRFAQVQTREYQEHITREKLNSGKEGEVVILLPSLAPIVFDTPTPTPMSPAWLQWKKVFL